MAQITGASSEKVFPIKQWLGLHESPDGDTKLKIGEAAVMQNFRVTRDGALQKRPGTREVLDIGDEPVKAVWTGYVASVERVMAICGSTLYSCWSGTGWETTTIGTFCGTVANDPYMFGFADKLYILTGSGYYEWDGTTFGEVEGYIPLVAVAVPPAGGGDTLQQVNKLSPSRRIWFSPDGTATVFKLPEDGIASVDRVYTTADDRDISQDDYTVDTAAGTVTFTAAPEAGTSTIGIVYSVSESFASEITAMRFSELYNGTQDTRVFLYGDGTNKAIYSGLDYDGNARADYFPDLNVVHVGTSNTPITGLIRHYSRLVCFKSDSTWSIQYGTISLDDGSTTAAFYVTPVNKSIGNEAMGQVQLVLNSPISLFGADVYEWRNNNSYALSVDERQARRISDRIYNTLKSFDFGKVVCYDDNYNQQYYIISVAAETLGNALVWNYASDAWSYYTRFYAVKPFSFHGGLYYGSALGGISRVSTSYTNDEYGERNGYHAIDCRWESGAISFGTDYERKYSAMLWVGIKPESRASVDVTVQTDRASEYTEKVISSSLFGFDNINFAAFTFATNRKPQIHRLKIKAKKFVYYKLILASNTADTSLTLTSADIRVRYQGYTK